MDHRRPSIEYVELRELGPKDWGQELLVAHRDFATMKRLHMRRGTFGPLQYHETKDETFFCESGRGWIQFDAGNGLVTRPFGPGQSIHIPPGAVHRVGADTECILFELSNPVFDDRVNVEREYGV